MLAGLIKVDTQLSRSSARSIAHSGHAYTAYIRPMKYHVGFPPTSTLKLIWVIRMYDEFVGIYFARNISSRCCLYTVHIFTSSMVWYWLILSMPYFTIDHFCQTSAHHMHILCSSNSPMIYFNCCIYQRTILKCGSNSVIFLCIYSDRFRYSTSQEAWFDVESVIGVKYLRVTELPLVRSIVIAL